MFGFSLSTPLAVLALAGWAATAGTYGVMWISKERAKVAAYSKGHEDGAASVSAAGVKGAIDAARARLEAENETPAVPSDKAALAALCKRSASCRERGQLR
jgi:hypothetical protein